MLSTIKSRFFLGIEIVALIFISVLPSFADSVNYVYDDLNRLQRVEYGDGGVMEYTYDEVGNRLVKTENYTVTGAPTGTISINGGAATISTTAVTLTLSATGSSTVSLMNLSNDGTNWPGWQAYATSAPWTLTTGDGVKTVFVQFKDAAGKVSTIYGDSIQLASYDLLPTAVAGPATGKLNAPITVTTTVENQGGSVTGAFEVGIYLSTDATITVGDIKLGADTVNSLAAGGLETQNTTVTILGTVTPGTYFLGAIADDGNTVVETVETNNALAGNTIVVSASLPDLITTAASASPTGVVGQPITVSATVKNQGPTAAGTFSVGLYFSTDATITTSDILFAAGTIGSFAPGAQATLSGAVPVPSGLPPGTYYFGSIADRTNTVAESIETNNALAGNQVTITAQ